MKAPSFPPGPTVIVVGGGIAGLAAAHRLHARGAEVLLVEARDRPGGVMRSHREAGFLVDLGPNTVVARRPSVPTLIEEVGLDNRMVRAPGATATRYVVRRGRPVALPGTAGSLLRTPLLSAGAKLRTLAEPFIGRSAEPEHESVAAFARRRLGSEVLDFAVDPFVSGVFAGDPDRLVLRHAFPAVCGLEREHRSLLLGAIRMMRAPRPAGAPPPDRRPFSFLGGLEELPRAVARSLGDVVRLSTKAVDVRRSGVGYSVTVETAAGAETHHSEKLILAVPPAALAELPLTPPTAARLLRDIPMPPVAVLGLGFRRDDVEHALDGFGVLVPGREPYRLLGALFSSSLFPERAPADHILLTCFLGGRRTPEDALLAKRRQLEIILPELRSLLGVRGDPVIVVRQLWPRAIPQYESRHAMVLDALGGLEAEHPGLAVAGNVRGGISVGDVVDSGLKAADAVLDRVTG